MKRRADTANRIRVLLADDHAITREGTRRLLETEADIQIVAEAADGEEAVRLAREVQPDVIVLDVSMPRMDGLKVAKVLRQTQPDTRVVVLTGYDSDQYASALLRLGVKGYLSKTASAQELASALRVVHAGQSCFQSAVAERLLGRGSGEGQEEATPRELEVLRLVAEGHRNRDIAQQLSTSERTVQFHLSNIFLKLGASSRTEMVHLARKRGWIV